MRSARPSKGRWSGYRDPKHDDRGTVNGWGKAELPFIWVAQVRHSTLIR